jgi:7,8-dihydropterin-6-yl-methyl-4-(beta-D-ribofuranosyl)aminobenzene 5'-phosphate synthase
MAALPEDPTFEEIEASGGTVDLHDEEHDILGRDGKTTGVRVSGEVPRVHPFEKGLPGAVTWMKDEDGKGGWFTDEVSLPAWTGDLLKRGSKSGTSGTWWWT